MSHRAYRLVFALLLGCLAVAITKQRCSAQIIKFSPQPRPSRHVRIYSALVCSADDSTEPMTANLATITRYAPPELPLLNPYARGYEEGRQPRHILLRVGDAVQDVSDGFIVGVATQAIEYDGAAWTKAAALYSFLWRKTRNPIEQTLNRALSQQEFWGELPIQIAPGGACQQAAVAALRPEDKAVRRAIESRSIEVRIPVNRPLSSLASQARFDAIDWQAAAAGAVMVMGMPCLVRPSSVEDEGCGSWWGG